MNPTVNQLLKYIVGISSLTKNIFKNCGLCNSDKKFPALINKLKNEIGTQFIFSLPPGICLSDIENRKEELETALNEPIKCDLTNNYKLVIQTYHLEYEKEYSLPNINTPANKLLFHTGVTCGSRIKSL
jgi:hypothetical protein